ncbi:MAG: hypothetical protein HYR96_02645 [Deltaproteobacteria bacterium]|nr:hypothetical protein [Deltaproteobacteria bacterium]MBI3296269.1 hypothetical protein [Deltaproteobacteria bacterium]
MKHLKLGLISRPHGLRGAFVLRQDSGPESPIQHLSRVYLATAAGVQGPFTVEEAAPLSRGWKIQLNELTSLEAVAPFLGAAVLAERDHVPKTAGKAEYFVEDLVGLAAFEGENRLGVIAGVEPGGGAPDRWWIRLDSGGELAVPAVKEYVEKVELTAGRVLLKNTNRLP